MHGRNVAAPDQASHAISGALIGTETLSLVIYRGEPDEIVSMTVIDVET